MRYLLTFKEKGPGGEERGREEKKLLCIVITIMIFSGVTLIFSLFVSL